MTKLLWLTFFVLKTGMNVTGKLQLMVLTEVKKKKKRATVQWVFYHFYCCFLTLSLKYSLCYLNGTSADWPGFLYLIVWKVLVKSVRPWRPCNLLSAIEPERHYVLGLACLFCLQLKRTDKTNSRRKDWGKCNFNTLVLMSSCIFLTLKRIHTNPYGIKCILL